MFSLHFRVCRFKKRYLGAGGTLSTGARPEPHLPTGGRGHVRRSYTRPEPPCPPAPLWHVDGAPPAHRGPGARALLWRVAGSPRPLGAGDTRAALVRGRSPPAEKQFSSNINQNCIWLMFDIKCQMKLYLVDV